MWSTSYRTSNTNQRATQNLSFNTQEYFTANVFTHPLKLTVNTGPLLYPAVSLHNFYISKGSKCFFCKCRTNCVALMNVLQTRRNKQDWAETRVRLHCTAIYCTCSPPPPTKSAKKPVNIRLAHIYAHLHPSKRGGGGHTHESD